MDKKFFMDQCDVCGDSIAESLWLGAAVELNVIGQFMGCRRCAADPTLADKLRELAMTKHGFGDGVEIAPWWHVGMSAEDLAKYNTEESHQG